MIDILKNQIKDIENFPIEGITFKDISGILESKFFKETIEMMSEKIETTPDYWVGIESRGFIFASALSILRGGGVLLCRKKNKLPPPIVSIDYELEYGVDTLSIRPGVGNVIVVDDVLATGGTMRAVEKLSINAGYNVIDKLVLINLKKLNNINDVKYLIDYE